MALNAMNSLVSKWSSLDSAMELEKSSKMKIHLQAKKFCC